MRPILRPIDLQGPDDFLLFGVNQSDGNGIWRVLHLFVTIFKLDPLLLRGEEGGHAPSMLTPGGVLRRDGGRETPSGYKAATNARKAAGKFPFSDGLFSMLINQLDNQ